MTVYLVIAIDLILLTLMGFPLMRRYLVNYLENALLQQNYAAFDNRIDKWYIRLFIPHFNVDFLKLNRAIMAGDKEDIDQKFEYFDQVNLKEKQKENLYLRGFEYYLSEDNRELTDKYYNLIKGLSNQGLIKYADQLYDIYVLKGWTYLDEMLAEEETLPEDQRLEVYSMISDMYKNKGDTKNAKKYENKIQTEIKNMM